MLKVSLQAELYDFFVKVKLVAAAHFLRMIESYHDFPCQSLTCQPTISIDCPSVILQARGGDY